MKKLLALLTVLCLIIAAVAAFAENDGVAPVTVRNGVTFGMTPDQVIAAEGNARFERDIERTWGPTFTEIEFENVNDNGMRADVKYFFVDNALVAVRMNYSTRQVSFREMLDRLAAVYGEPAALDAAALGNAVFAVDDDGRPEYGAMAFTAGDAVIVVEQDEDDIDVTFLDLTAAYVR